MNSIKTCSKCGMSKPTDEFNNDKKRKDGRYPQCKECNKQYYQEHKEELLEYQKTHRNNNKEKTAERKKAYYQKHKKEIADKQREYRKSRVEELAKYQKIYRAKNKEKLAEHQKISREKKKEKTVKESWVYYQKNRGNILERVKKHARTNTGKISISKVYARRKRDMGYIPLNNRFDGCEGHHVDNEQVIFIPAEMHRSNPHRQSDPKTMIKINKLAFDYLNKQCCA